MTNIKTLMTYLSRKKLTTPLFLASLPLFFGHSVHAGSDLYFIPLTQSAFVVTPNHVKEKTAPWVAPKGVTQRNLTSLSEIEADARQSVIRSDNGNNASKFDMMAFDPTGKFIFIPHETYSSAGLSRYNIEKDVSEVLLYGDGEGLKGNWENDYGSFDPARFTPNGTVILAEEWSGLGRVFEVTNPMAPVADIKVRELQGIANVSHEGIQFSKQFKDTIYFIDEYESGSIYKFVMTTAGDYSQGQTFVLSVDAFKGKPASSWNAWGQKSKTRTGAATWKPLTDANGKPLTKTNPFRNGPPGNPSDPNTLGGRGSADEAGGTPYGRPEDIEVGTLANGHEVFYFTATAEQTVYSVEVIKGTSAYVRIFANETQTPKNLGQAKTSATLNAPDNLAQDANGNIYIVEDAPNGSNIGGDVWFARDINNDGVAESLDHFLSIQVAGSESTGMIFNPVKPNEFVLSVQHPTSTTLGKDKQGFGDAIWLFDISKIVSPVIKSKTRK